MIILSTTEKAARLINTVIAVRNVLDSGVADKSVNKLIGSLIEATERLLEDEHGVLVWYVVENKLGAAGLRMMGALVPDTGSLVLLMASMYNWPDVQVLKQERKLSLVKH